MNKLRIAMAQINLTVGDLAGNSKKIVSYARDAACLGADLVIFPELSTTGYPPEDLLLRPSFVEDNLKHINAIARKIKDIAAIVGFVDKKTGIYNAAALIKDGEIRDVYHKMYLPNYGVFDEQRYFQGGTTPLNFTLNNVTIGIGICEDIWYPEGPARLQSLAGASVICNINASPYHAGKLWIREEMLKTRAMDNGVIIAYNNAVGGQDELIFDGQGMIISENGATLERGGAFVEDLVAADLDIGAALSPRMRGAGKTGVRSKAAPQAVRHIDLGAGRQAKKPELPKRNVQALPVIDEMLRALILGVRDYARKNKFTHAVVGLSGGIDSSVVAALAGLAVGRKNITGVFMPSRYTARQSRKDAEALARNLGVRLMTIPIENAFSSYLSTLKQAFKGCKTDVTEENLQARIRGNILMALSNKFGWLVLTTGNKSELSVGYATLYGDMAGGFSAIKDVPKTTVYALAKRINEMAGKAVIPEAVFTKAPTAELRPNQTDQDALPPYDALDGILKAYIEEDKGVSEICKMGHARAIVKKVIEMVDSSEYKRRQSPPGIKITPRAFGKDRRMPITNQYKNGLRKK
ncbi:MAG: NAD+ synthase [Deltaproteobacteria bacterium]